MTETRVSSETADGVATLTLRGPDASDSPSLLTRAMLGEIGAAVDAALASPDVGALLVTGGGERAFLEGVDVRELSGLDPAGALELALEAQAVFDRLERGGKPTLAALNGHALGAGCELALACHLRVMAAGATIGLPAVGLGLIPGFGGTQRLARLVGRGRALEMVLTGRCLAAPDALALGLVGSVVPRSEIDRHARDLLARVLAQGPVAVRLALEAVNHGLDLAPDDGAWLEASLFSLAFATDDAREGTRAFLEKRAPRFTGR